MTETWQGSEERPQTEVDSLLLSSDEPGSARLLVRMTRTVETLAESASVVMNVRAQRYEYCAGINRERDARS